MRFNWIAAILLFATWATSAEIGIPNIADNPESRFDVYGNFLFWYASEEPSDSWANVIQTTINDEGIQDTFDVVPLAFDWNFGFRAGVGYHLEQDQWDTQLYWSWFRTQTEADLSSGTIIPEFFGSFLNGDLANFGKIHWSLLYNMCDWELGRSYWVSQCLLFRPFMGLKGGWIHQSILSNWNIVEQSIPGSSPMSVHYTSQENLKNNFWGIGPTSGIGTQWKLAGFGSHLLSLFGDFSASMLWGTWNFSDEYENSSPYEISVNVQPQNLGCLMVRGFMGLGWETCFSRQGTRFSMQVGYETQLWFNQLQIPTFQQLCLHGDLTLQGGTLSSRFDF